MPRITVPVSIDCARINRFRVTVSKQGDVNSRFLNVTLTVNDIPFSVEKANQVFINCYRADGKTKSFVGDVNDDGTVMVPLPKWLLKCEGDACCEIVVVNTNNQEKLSSTRFNLFIEPNICDDFETDEDASKDFLLELLTKIDTVTEQLKNISDLQQSSLDNGKLKDVAVIRTIEEYDRFMESAESLFEEMQEGEYVLVVLIETDTGDGEPVTIITTMSKENGELVFNDGFSTGDLKEYIKDKVRESAKPLEEGLKAVTPVLDEGLDLAFELKHNCEHRRYEPETLGSTWLQLLLPSELPKDFISGLVFVSGEKSRVFNYPDSIIFTGDDVIDDVLVPMANKVYNVVFWYDGINVNAVSRGVPYAKE